MYEILVGLQVVNGEMYKKYRSAIESILNSYGGGFDFDCVISEVLLSQFEMPINRLFIIKFPSQVAASEFFYDSEYLQVKKRYFEGAVLSTTIISRYEKTISEY